MKRAVLLAGWILVTPPWYSESVTAELRLNKDAPLAEWKHQHSFDTAAECEAFKRGAVKGAKEPNLLAMFDAARCVPPELVYPPKS